MSVEYGNENKDDADQTVFRGGYEPSQYDTDNERNSTVQHIIEEIPSEPLYRSVFKIFFTHLYTCIKRCHTWIRSISHTRPKRYRPSTLRVPDTT